MIEFKIGLIIRDPFGVYWVLVKDKDSHNSNDNNLNEKQFHIGFDDTLGTDIFT